MTREVRSLLTGTRGGRGSEKRFEADEVIFAAEGELSEVRKLRGTGPLMDCLATLLTLTRLPLVLVPSGKYPIIISALALPSPTLPPRPFLHESIARRPQVRGFVYVRRR